MGTSIALKSIIKDCANAYRFLTNTTDLIPSGELASKLRSITNNSSTITTPTVLNSGGCSYTNLYSLQSGEVNTLSTYNPDPIAGTQTSFILDSYTSGGVY